MSKPKRGEVWQVDLGIQGKIRPCLVISVEPGDSDRELATFVAHTTSVRGSQFEVVIRARFLKAGAFNAQDIYTIARASNKFMKRLGKLNADQLAEVEFAVKGWLGFIDESASDEP